MQHRVDEVIAREVAAATLADVRTVRRVMRGEQVRGLVGARIRAELDRKGSIPAVGSAPSVATKGDRSATTTTAGGEFAASTSGVERLKGEGTRNGG